MGLGIWLRGGTICLGGRRQEQAAGNLKHLSLVISHLSFSIFCHRVPVQESRAGRGSRKRNDAIIENDKCEMTNDKCLSFLLLLLPPAPAFSSGINPQTKLVVECAYLRTPFSEAAAFAHDHR